MKKRLFIKAGLMITALTIVTTLHAQKKPAGQAPKKSYGIKNNYISVENDTSSIPGLKIVNYRDKHDYKIKMTDDKIIELIVDNKKIPEAEFYKYDSLIKKLRDQIRKDEEMAEQDRQEAIIDREQAELDRKEAEKDSELAEKDREQSIEDREQAEEDEKMAEEDRKQAMEDREQAEIDRSEAEKDREEAKLDAKKAEEDKALVKSLVNDLIKENVIKNEKDLISLNLKEGELTVNDKKQPESLYQKFKAKYLKNPRTQIWYNNSKNFRGLSISNDDDDRQ